MTTARELDANGYLTVKDCPVSSYGVFDYGAGQLGLDGDPNRIVKVYRPKSELMEPEALSSFCNIPLIDNHTYLTGNPEVTEDDDEVGVAPEEKGIHGVMLGNVHFVDPWMLVDVKMFSRQLQEDVDAGKVELSLGYTCEFIEQAGTFNGEAYEFVQRKMRGNHLALVDEARVTGARILDGLVFDHLNFSIKPSKKDINMSKVTKKKVGDASTVEALRTALNAFLDQEAAEPEHTEAVEGDEEINVEKVEAIPGDEMPDAATGDSDTDLEGSADSELANLLMQVKACLEKADEEKVGDEDETDEEKVGDEDNTGEAKIGDGEDLDAAAKGKGSPVGDAAMLKRAIKAVAADSAIKEKLVERLSNHIGNFAAVARAMDSRDVAAYGIKKLGIKCPKGTERVALDAYLTGAEKASKKFSSVAKSTPSVGDSAMGSSSELDAFLKGTK